MAVRNHSIAAHILSHFFDFYELVKVAPHGNGHINDTFKVVLRKGEEQNTYLLQRINHQVFPQPELVMQNIQFVANHLTNQDYPLEVLSAFPTKKGKYFFLDASGNHWRVFNFFKNTIALEKVSTREQAYQAAKAFGQFASALNGIDVSALNITIPQFHDGIKRWNDFETGTRTASIERSKAAKNEIEQVIENKNLFEIIDKLNLPIRVVHHDTKINNVLLDNTSGKAVCVIDLDTVMPGIVLSDFGDMVRTFTNPLGEEETDISKIKMRMDIYESLKEGFLSEMGDYLSNDEKNTLPLAGAWLTLMQAVRFLGDYLEGDIYYKTQYPSHNLVRAKNQLALFRSIKNNLDLSW